jgi:hypothetical protein
VNRPNDLIQVDYMYFFRYITGAPLIDGDEDMTDAQRKKLESKLSKKLDTECSAPVIGCTAGLHSAPVIRRTI